MAKRSLTALKAALLLSCCLLASGAGAQTTENSQPADLSADSLPQRLVEDLNAAFGKHHAQIGRAHV